MSHLLGWFRQLIEEPEDFCLDAVLERDRTAARNPVSVHPPARGALVLDLSRLGQRTRSALL